MRLPSRRPARLAAALLALSLSAAACGGDDGTSSAGGSGGEGSGVEGDVFVSGSSTVEPISVRVAELLEDVEPDVVVDVEGPGTGDGFELFCNGEADIADASRAIKPEEIESCEANGIEFIELKVAFDGLAVLTNPANEAVACLSTEDLYAIVGPESQGVDTWDAAGELAAELGSDTELPSTDLAITAPGEESGTYDSFVELVIADIAEERGEEAQTRPDYSSQSDDNAIITGIQGAEGSFGWVGLAYAEEAEDVKVLEVDGGDGCVAPTAESVTDGSYPLSRPLFIYVNAASMEENPAIEAYVDFYLEEGLEAVSEVGYVPLGDEDMTATRSAWEDRSTGTRES